MEHLQWILLVDLIAECFKDAIMLKDERARIRYLSTIFITSSLLVYKLLDHLVKAILDEALRLILGAFLRAEHVNEKLAKSDVDFYFVERLLDWQRCHNRHIRKRNRGDTIIIDWTSLPCYGIIALAL